MLIRWFSLLLVGVALLMLSCSGQSGVPPNEDATAEGSPVAQPGSMDRPEVFYLEGVIPPCTVQFDDRDPCPVQPPTVLETLSVRAAPPYWPYNNEIPTFEQLLIRERSGVGLTPHIVVRGVVIPDTTRCAPYPSVPANYKSLNAIAGLYHYHCFVDVAINEYIVGSGPLKLTVSMYRENLRNINLQNWQNIKEEATQHLDDPRARTAEAYEGKELVLFLDLPFTVAVESWDGKGYFKIWSVQKNESNDIRAVADDIYYARTDEQRARLDIPLEELTRQVKEAASIRTKITEGRIGQDTDLPLLVTDANYLQDFYISEGAVYDDSEGATVLPPPPPEKGGYAREVSEPTLVEEMERAEVAYLEEVILPCVPVTGSEQDPCEVVYPPPIVEAATVHSHPGWPLYDDMPPSFTGMLLGESYEIGYMPTWAPHIVVRATVLPDTTRCGLYNLDFFDHVQERLQLLELFQSLNIYHCFADFRINEYIVGTGPPKMTVSLFRENFPLADEQQENWDSIKDDFVLNYLQDPRSRVAEAYEGKELVMFLQPADNIAVESWERGYQFSTWFLYRVGNNVRALEANIRYARTDEQHNKLDLPLDELIEGLKQAGEEKYTMTGGKIGIDADLPMLITDANFLKDFYPAAGTIYYESGGKTVLPPPVPGEGDPDAPTVPTNKGNDDQTDAISPAGDG